MKRRILKEYRVLPLLSLPDLLQRGATMEPPFDILKKIDAVNFEWVEVVRDLQAAEATIQELQTRWPGEYVVFSRRTQQIVGRFSTMRSLSAASAAETALQKLNRKGAL
jgi:hypothetical protein